MYYPLANRYDYWGLGFGMSIFWFIVIVIIGLLIVRSLRRHEWHEWQQNQGQNTTAKTDPLDIAKERYAKGEITKDEFEQLKKDLK